jgi:succinoglycan biosynthesis protein ExoA
VVIPCLNEAGHIESVIEQLLGDSTPAGGPEGQPLELRVVVADGGSTDGTQEIVQGLAADPRVRLLDNPGRIQSSAVNRAVEAFGDDVEYFVRLDAHSQYPPGFCAELLAEAEQTGADSVVVTMRTAGTGTFQRAAAAAQNSPLGNGGSAHRNAGDGAGGQWVDHGHHALMRVSAFRAVGGYDEEFTHNEDAELDVRLGQAGFRIWLTYRTWSVYFPRETPSALLQQYINYGSGRAANVLKHGTVPKVRQLLPLMVAPAVAVAVVFRVIRLPFISRLATLPAKVWALGCLGYGAALARKQHDPAAALAGPAAMLMHLGWSIGFWRRVIAYARATRSTR